MAKVTFDGDNSLIIVNNGETLLNVQEDLYSEWKNWVVLGNNSNYLQAFRNTGGDPLVGSLSIAAYFFLLNGWRIRPYEGNHVLNIDGNLFVDGGGSPFVQTVGNYNVLTNMLSSVNAVQIETGTSGLTTEESTKLDNIYTTNTENALELDNISTHILALSASMIDISTDLKRVLGLMHENIFIDQPTYDSDGNLVGARVRIYSNPASVGTASDVIGTYTITSASSGPGKFTTWQQVRI